ncbi:hypothetical protein HN954_02315 [bacterium]|jgi:hypothetical protein|nr:hypothetical protein [bacterium]MBT6831558.1 hypothetical protein [bacterium]MBT6996239.1 hypothetical protein [bacterium]MBT7772280.1 hypothetical protein [bacterium]
MTNNCQNGGGEPIEEDVKEIMESQGVDADQAEKVRDVMEEYNLDEDEAVEIAEEI